MPNRQRRRAVPRHRSARAGVRGAVQPLGGASRQALEQLPALLALAQPAALVVMQDFVVARRMGARRSARR